MGVISLSPAATTRTLLLLLSLYAGCFLLFLSLSHHVAAAPSPTSFSFDFSDSSSYSLDDLRFEGDAALHGNLVELTCASCKPRENQFRKGRMSYNHSVPFYDNATGEMVGFSTRFTFAIRWIKGAQRASGMAFFLAGYPSTVPPDSTDYTLGLISKGKQTALGADRFIAVEFDTFASPEADPPGASDHIGIDISSVTSVNTTMLPRLRLSGTMTASVTFNSSTRMLLSSLQFDDDASLAPAQVSTQLPDPVTDLLPPEVAVGFSASTGTYFELHQILSWSFNSTLTSNETPAANSTETPAANGTETPATETSGANSTNLSVNVREKQAREARRKKGRKIATITGGAAFLSVPLVWSVLSYFISKHALFSFVKRVGLSQFPRLEFQDLVDQATGKFSEERKLGDGTFGEIVYKAIMKNNGQQEEVAVKEIKEYPKGENKAFLDELKANQMNHKNLVKLKGWCSNPNKRKLLDFMCWCRKKVVEILLVYELMPNGNLDEHLHEREEVLSWARRYQIVKDIGSVVRYLHHDCKPCILHRDIKPANVLLDDDFNAKLANLGISRVADHNSTTSRVYMDPQCMRKDRKVGFSRKSDVYSFGVVLLEIACTGKTREKVQDLYTRRTENFMEDAADDKLEGVFVKKEMEHVVVLGLRCSHPDGGKRPSLDDAMQFLENGKELPAINIEGGNNAISMASPSSEQPLVSAGTSPLRGGYYD